MTDTPLIWHDPKTGLPLPADQQGPAPDYRADFLLEAKARLLRGEDGLDPTSYDAKTRLADLDAKIAMGRRLGSVSPEPEPPATLAARAALSQAFPMGAPEPMGAMLTTAIKARLDQIASLDAASLAQLRADTIENLGDHAIPGGNAVYALKGLNGLDQLKALLADAEPELKAIYPDPRQRDKARDALSGNRKYLELLAQRARYTRTYAAAQQEYGLAPKAATRLPRVADEWKNSR